MYRFSQTPVKCDKIITKNRRIVTSIPAPSTITILEECNKNEPSSMNDQLPIVWDRALDFYIFDNAGNKWIDFTSSIFVANVGHSNEKVINAIRYEIDKKLLNSYYYPTEERASFSNLLISITPPNFEKVLYLSTGSEAVEAALKMSIKFTARNKVISFQGGFHGKTMGSQLAGGKKDSQKWIPVESYVTHIPFPNSWEMKENGLDEDKYFDKYFESLESTDYAAVIVEPYQGWSAEFLPIKYAQKLRKWCDDNGVLLIIDEIQSGFGRTGKLFAFEHFNIIPDIITCAKGISSSLPLSCVITSTKIINTCMSYNSTHGGNPVAVAASHASVKYLIENKLIEESEIKGKILYKELCKWKEEYPQYITKINCKGLLASVFIKSPDGNNIECVDKLIEIAMRKGLMSVRTASGTLKIGPPLTISEDALIEGIEVLKESFKECLDI